MPVLTRDCQLRTRREGVSAQPLTILLLPLGGNGFVVDSDVLDVEEEELLIAGGSPLGHLGWSELGWEGFWSEVDFVRMWVRGYWGVLERGSARLGKLRVCRAQDCLLRAKN